jgi:hypothetical protein
MNERMSVFREYCRRNGRFYDKHNIDGILNEIRDALLSGSMSCSIMNDSEVKWRVKINTIMINVKFYNKCNILTLPGDEDALT